MKRSPTACLAILSVASVGTLFGCTATRLAPPDEFSGETHFLRSCASDVECGSALRCVCGTCTLACEQPRDCEALAAGARCEPVADESSCAGAVPTRTCTGACPLGAVCGEAAGALSGCGDTDCTADLDAAVTAVAADTGPMGFVLADECVVSGETIGLGSVPAPPARCGTAPRDCGDGAGTCQASPLTRALEQAIAPCNVYCGDLQLAVAGGCITDLAETTPPGVTPNLEATRACIRDALVGTSWPCLTRDGWVRYFIGSCTLH